MKFQVSVFAFDRHDMDNPIPLFAKRYLHLSLIAGSIPHNEYRFNSRLDLSAPRRLTA
jgi:hypothetical protein